MNQQNLNTCPICGTNIEDGICPKCGYIRLIFPEIVPESIKNSEIRRVNAAKALFKARQEQEKHYESQRADSEAKIANLNRELSEYFDTKKILSKEKAALIDEVNSLKRQMSIIKEQLEDAKSQGQTSSKKYQSRITDLESQVHRKDSEIKSISDELENVRSRLNQSLLNMGNRLKGVVMIEDRRNDTRTMLPIYDGTNSYGTNQDNGLHHQINFQIRGFSFQPVHFYIRTSSKGLILESAPGVEMTQNGGIVRSGVYARQSDNFMFGERVRINITQI